MYAPIYHPQAPAPSPAVLDAERTILSAEGPHHVGGRYYANTFDAERMRRMAAERRVSEATRRETWTARRSAMAGVPRPRVVAWLTPRECARVEAATDGVLTLATRETLPAVRSDLTAGRADAVLVSAARVQPADVPTLAGVVRAFPGTPVAGLVAEADDPQAITGALLLGRAGVGTVLDCRTPGGWTALRGTFTPRHLPDAFLRACVASVLADVRGREDGTTDDAGYTDGLVRFFVLAFAPDVTSARQVAAGLGVLPSTLMSRFFRAGLPSPKRYVALARLAWAAHLGEQPGLSISAIAHRLDASSPQSFHRMVRTLTGRTATEFRRTTTGAAMLDHYRAALVTSYRDTLRTFDPLHLAPAPIGARARVPFVAGRAA